MYFLIPLGLAVVAGYMFAPVINARLPKQYFLVIYDGAVWHRHRARKVSVGLQVGKTLYEEPLYYPVELRPGLVVCYLGAERIPLANHKQLEEAREFAAPTHMFKGGGDLRRYLAMVAPVLIIAAALWTTLTVSSLGAQIAELRAGLVLVQEKLDQPSVLVRPVPAPTDLPLEVTP